MIREGALRVKEETLLIVDLTDIRKKYAREMEYLGRVRDGSEEVVGRGYWVSTEVGAEAESP